MDPGNSIYPEAHRFDDSILSANSSEPLSSPPDSPGLHTSPPHGRGKNGAISGVASTTSRTSAPMLPSTSTPLPHQIPGSSNVASLINPAPPVRKRGPKKKELTAEEIAAKANAPPKKRGPKAKPKDPNAPPPQRKRKAASDAAQPSTSLPQHTMQAPDMNNPSLSRQPKIADLVSTMHVQP